MFNLNRVALAGNLTRDPEVKPVGNGSRMVAKFGLAINHKYKTKDGEAKEEVTFVDVEAWGRTAELIGQYLHKGRPVYLEGRLQLDQWEDKDGQKRSKLKVVAENVQFLGSKREDNADAEPVKAQASAQTASSADDKGSEPPF